MGQKAKWEYVRAIYERYRQADWKREHAILNEFGEEDSWGIETAAGL
jgi:hypothetical protein